MIIFNFIIMRQVIYTQEVFAPTADAPKNRWFCNINDFVYSNILASATDWLDVYKVAEVRFFDDGCVEKNVFENPEVISVSFENFQTAHEHRFHSCSGSADVGKLLYVETAFSADIGQGGPFGFFYEFLMAAHRVAGYLPKYGFGSIKIMRIYHGTLGCAFETELVNVARPEKSGQMCVSAQACLDWATYATEAYEAQYHKTYMIF